MKHARKQARRLVTAWAEAAQCSASSPAHLAALEAEIAAALFERTRHAAATVCEHCRAGAKRTEDGWHALGIKNGKVMRTTCWAAEIWKAAK